MMLACTSIKTVTILGPTTPKKNKNNDTELSSVDICPSPPPYKLNAVCKSSWKGEKAFTNWPSGLMHWTQVHGQPVRDVAYKTLVRPTLEYCNTIWDPYQLSNITTIDKVQRRAARFVLKDYSRTSSVTNMLNKLDWDTPSRIDGLKPVYAYSTRKLMDFPTIYKIINQLQYPVILPDSLQVIIPTPVFQPTKTVFSTHCIQEPSRNGMPCQIISEVPNQSPYSKLKPNWTT